MKKIFAKTAIVSPVLFFYALLAFVTGDTSQHIYAQSPTQSSCHILTPSSSVPTGFGVPYNTQSSAKTLLLSVTCSSSSAIVSAGTGENTQYIYKQGYEYKNNAWVPFTFEGVESAAVWLAGRGTKSFQKTQAELSVNNFVVGYVCIWNGATWKCGCRDQVCTTSLWQLQSFKNEVGGSTTGTTGTSTGTSGGGSTGGDSTLPQSTRIVEVSSTSALGSALQNAQPGDHIILANGNYSGFTVSKNGAQNKPIVIKAAQTLGAKINGDITLNGNDVWVVGVDVGNGGSAMVQGTRNRVSSSRFKSQGTSISVTETARLATVDHNDIDSQTTGKEIAWYGIALKFAPNESGHKHHVFRNHLYGAPALTTGDDNTAIGCSTNGNRRNSESESLIEYNLIHDWKGDGEVIMTKSSKCTIQFNTIVNSLEIDTRVGYRNKWIANWCENTKGIRIHDRENEVIGNRCNVRVMGGNAVPNQAGGALSGGHPQAIQTLVAGNTGELIVGYNFAGQTLPARDTKVEGHIGTVKKQNEVATTIISSTQRTIPQAFKLAPSQVGPNATTAPR